MREQLFACEPTALISTLEQIENASAAEIRLAASMFEEDDDETDPVDDIYDEDTDPDGSVKACIRVEGMLTQNGPSPLARLFGITGTSYKAIAGACDRAMASGCKAVTLAINSPGGEAAGVDACWQKVAALSAKKPCMAENHGMMASAAYWLATACPQIKAMSPACEQGSIGVKIVAIDDSEAMKAGGRKLVTIVSKNAPAKNDDVSTKSGREALQARADAMESVFIARVAEGRRIPVQTVIDGFGQGAVLIASEAKRVGMIDDVQMRADSGPGGPSVPDPSSRQLAAAPGALVAQASPGSPAPKEKPMTFKELIASDPAAKAELDQMLAQARKAGADEVQARITAAKPYLALQATRDGYSEAEAASIAKCAIDVIAGAEDAGALRGFVRMVDMNVEQRKQMAAQGETHAAGETPPLKLEDNAELLAKAAALKIDVAAVQAAALAAKTDPVQALLGEIALQEAAQGKRATGGVRGL